MKTTRSIITGVILSFATIGAAYADGGGHNPAQIFSNQTERLQTAQANTAEMSAPRPGWNNGSQYGGEWLTRKTSDHSEVNSASQSSAGVASQPGVNAGQSLTMHGGYKEHNHNGSVTETH